MQIRIKFRRARQTHDIILNAERTRAVSRHHFRSRFAAQHQIGTLQLLISVPLSHLVAQAQSPLALFGADTPHTLIEPTVHSRSHRSCCSA